MAKFQIILVTTLIALASNVDAHGRLMKPPNRSSVWRVPEFAHQNPPQNREDNQLYCGGLHQAEDPGSECGVCGDPKGQPRPRDNEFGGKYDAGIIVGRYTAGQVIDIEVLLTDISLGNMEWRLCTNPNQESQQCFNQHVLQFANGNGTKLPADHGFGNYTTQLKLPDGVRCERCVIQWNYRTGNSWGTCPDGSQGLGCGPQETFRGCSDVSIS